VSYDRILPISTSTDKILLKIESSPGLDDDEVICGRGKRFVDNCRIVK
jgi:hypothetical protein